MTAFVDPSPKVHTDSENFSGSSSTDVNQLAGRKPLSTLVDNVSQHSSYPNFSKELPRADLLTESRAPETRFFQLAKETFSSNPHNNPASVLTPQSDTKHPRYGDVKISGSNSASSVSIATLDRSSSTNSLNKGAILNAFTPDTSLAEASDLSVQHFSNETPVSFALGSFEPPRSGSPSRSLRSASSSRSSSTSQEHPKDYKEPPRKRRRTSPDELQILEFEFARNSRPCKEDRERIASLTSKDEKAVQVWFQNKRQSCRRQQNGTGMIPALVRSISYADDSGNMSVGANSSASSSVNALVNASITASAPNPSSHSSSFSLSVGVNPEFATPSHHPASNVYHPGAMATPLVRNTNSRAPNLINCSIPSPLPHAGMTSFYSNYPALSPSNISAVSQSSPLRTRTPEHSAADPVNDAANNSANTSTKTSANTSTNTSHGSGKTVNISAAQLSANVAPYSAPAETFPDLSFGMLPSIKSETNVTIKRSKALRLSMSADGKAELVERSPLKPTNRAPVPAQRHETMPTPRSALTGFEQECASSLLVLKSGQW